MRQTTSDDWIPETAKAWDEWLVDQEGETVAAYRKKPAFLISHYRGEVATARDYQGREVLELLQNANDQAAELGERSRVHIELSENSLIVANTGLPFSVGGVSSLQMSHLSPKRHKRAKLIGNKGLGFRAILNWTRTPVILSGALSIAYTLDRAREILDELIATDQHLARLVAQERNDGTELVIPLLPFPIHSPSGDLARLIPDPIMLNVFDRCEALLVDGYDTVIGMPFESQAAAQAAEMQLATIRPEVLLFVQNLSELQFQRAGKTVETWKRDRREEFDQVKWGSKILGEWRLYRRSGKLPEPIANHPRDVMDFEVAVGIPAVKQTASNLLYSYFPTDVLVPLPCVCHGSLELEQNRKHIQQGSEANKFVLGELGDLLGEIAEVIVSNPLADPWDGCSLLIPLVQYPEELRREGFTEVVLTNAKSRRIIPTLSGVHATASKTKRMPGSETWWAPQRLFPEVVPVRSADDDKFLVSLGVVPLELLEIKRRITGANDLTLEERVSIVRGLLAQFSLRDICTSALLLDSRGRALDDAVRVFLPPSTGEFPEMPDWAELKFLNAAMREKLADELKVKEARELQQKLAPFGVMEYSLANLIRALVAEANRRVRQKPDEANQYRSDLLRIVARLFVSESRGNKRPDYPDQSPIYLKTQGGGYAVATSLYLGKGFGPQGEIVQALFEPTAPEKLIDEESLLLFDRDAHALEEFLIWMGVAKWPREMSEKRPHPEYLKHVLTTLRTPARFEDKVIDSGAELDAARVEEVKTIDGLENIILSGEPTAVAAWLATDVRAIGWGRPSRAHAQLHGFPPSTNKARVYQGPLPSYIRWRLETTKWLSDNEGRPLRPKDCVLGERAIEELFPRPFMPDDEILNRLGVSAQDILDGWRNGGVLTSLASIERDEIYAKLLELPDRSPDGKLARPLYHWLLDASDVALGGDGPFQTEFRRRGLMWGKNAAASKYFPINELHHADADGVPDGLLKKLSIVDLRKRVGADKVEKVFGVKPIDRAGILRKVQAKQIAVGSIDANREFQASKPYLHNLRISETRQRGQLQILKDLQLEICSTITVDISFEDLAFTYEIPIWGWIVEDRMLYVRSDPARPLELAGALLSNAISEALASEIFRISDGGDFARILSCKEGDRPELLRRLRGDDALTDIDDIKAEYDEFVDRTAERARFPISEPPTQQLTKDLSVTETMSTEPPPSTSTNEETAKGPAQPPHVLQIDHQPEVTRTREIQITRAVGGERIGPTEYHAADPDFAERKAMEFEESASQGRWPLRVGHIMGSDGPRCDILSFASKEARDMFVTGPERDLGSVVRFIEVKGRTSSGAAIELKGNALAAAETFHERYYIYRLFESPDGYYSLAVLSNPLARKSALRPAVYVGLQQAVETEQFLIVGGIER